MDKTEFLEMFPCCGELAAYCGGLEKAFVTAAVLRRESMTMEIEAFFDTMPAPAELGGLERQIAAYFGLSRVTIQADFPRVTESKRKAAAEKAAACFSARASRALLPPWAK